jgi:hypothetical protein
MKKIVPVLAILFACNAAGFAQCDKKVNIHSSKTEHLGADSTVERTEEENTLIEIREKSIVVSPGDHKMTGTIISDTCNWKIPFIEGKTTLIVSFPDEQGNARKGTIVIEGKEGKLSLLFKPEGMPGTIRAPIDKFEQVN